MNINDYFGGIFYINLEQRIDRKDEMEKELNNMELKYERFNAIKNNDGNPGCVGCFKSHIAILKHAKENNLKNVVIFEDDFSFKVSKEEFFKQIKTFFDKNIEFDVLMLSYGLLSYKEYDDQLIKIHEAQTASGYIVNSCFYDTLINLFDECLELLITTRCHWLFVNDQCWKMLQPKSNWYAFKKHIGVQRPSFSDLAGAFVDYKK